MPNKALYKRLVLRIIYAGLFLLFLFYIVPLIFVYLAPFIFALVIAALLNPFVSLIVKKFRMSRRFVSFMAVFLVFLGIAGLIVWFIYTLVNETMELALNTTDIINNITASVELVMDYLERIAAYWPGDADTVFNNITVFITEWLREAGKQFSDNILTNTWDATIRVGNVVIAVIVFVLSAFFLTADYHKIGGALKRFDGVYIYDRLKDIKESAGFAFGGYIKAQLILMLIAFLLLLTAFTIYGQNFAFLVSLIIAIIDFLPFLGAGTVLIPWAVIAFIGQDVVMAVFLLALSLALFLIRRFAEPKIVSVHVGITPIAALISTYIGMRFAGFIGLIAGPIVMVVIISIIRTGILENTKKDLTELAGILANTLRRDG